MKGKLIKEYKKQGVKVYEWHEDRDGCTPAIDGVLIVKGRKSEHVYTVNIIEILDMVLK